MNRKELFRKLFEKTAHLTFEKVDEIQESIRRSLSPIYPMANPNQDSEVPRPTQPKEKIQKTKQYPQKNKKKTKHGFLGIQPPPGHILPLSKFQNTCTGCGDCVFACPYHAIFPVYDDQKQKNFPFLDVNANACHLCEDWPCIQSCQFGALKPFNKGKVRKMGQAKGLFQYCINHKTGEKTCNSCEEACPIEKTVIFRKNQPIFKDSCVGCGLCVQACPTYPKSIRIS